MDSAMRAKSTGRTLDTRRTQHEKESDRHSSVQPFNKSIYGKMHPKQPRSHFKASVEFLQATQRSSLGDGDQTLKKILDDNRVQQVFNERVQVSHKEDDIRSGIASLR